MVEAEQHAVGERAYEPRGAALDLFYCRDREVLVEGPAGTGKTRAVLEKLHLCAMKYPGMRGLIVRQTRASCTQSVLVTYEQHVVQEGYASIAGADKAQRSSYHYPNGSELVIAGLDDAQRIMSAEYDMVAVFEATEIREEDWELLLTRIRHAAMPYRQAIADCNPSGPTHWLNRRAADGTMTRLCSRHADNPTCTPEYLDSLSKLTGARRERLYLGRWAGSSGCVYPEFDRQVHVIQFQPPESWRRIRSIDFGFRNPFVCQWWALDEDERMYLYREVYMTGRLVEDHARMIVSLSEGENIETTVADHDAEDAATLRRHGVSSTPARKDVQAGIQAVAARLARSGDGRPRLFFCEGARVELDGSLSDARLPACTVEEIDSYTWAPAQAGGNVKEAPVKRDDHGMDAMRYACMQLDGGDRLGVSLVTARRREEE